MTTNNCTSKTTKNKKHRQLTLCDRRYLSRWLAKGKSQVEIAERLGVHPSTVCREIKRGKLASASDYYSYTKSYQETEEKRKNANQMHCKIVYGGDLEEDIQKCLLLYWSPEQMVGSKAVQGVSVKTIYNWLQNLPAAHYKSWRKYFRHGGKHRPAGSAESRRLYRARDKRSIKERPESVEDRVEFGHWEGDTIVSPRGHKGCLVTLVERSSGYLLASYIPRATKDLFAAACIDLLKEIKPEGRKTLTLDNGSEMNGFKEIEKETGATVYFADPHSSWQRGTNENTNGLIRQFFPKGTKFTKNSAEKLAIAAYLINNRPKKRLEYKTSKQAFQKYIEKEVLEIAF